ncbi:nSTAND1 domain-containing NTPase [Thermomonospora amylolytica]|uniref:nSTAND1 domain-containing NTPase n=1 Tax=Thermomonospora amylolytica TaxID=1411117 RepID=UPI000E6BE481|nr:AAA family ATPase [Thermomonospora amylolytica]
MERRDNAAAQDGVRDRIARLVRSTGAGARRWTPPVLMAVLCAGSLSPLLIAGMGASALATVGVGTAAAVGGNVLTDVIRGALEWMRGRDAQPSREDVESELERRIEEVLQAGGERADRLRADIAEVLRQVGAVGAAVEAAVAAGDREVLDGLSAGLAELGGRFEEFGFLRTELASGLAAIQEDLDRQGAVQQTILNLLNRQATDMRRLREDVIARGARDTGARPGSGMRWEHGCPYPGLVPFTEDRAEVFYGREQTTAELVGLLVRRPAGITVVTGASGAGKSSLLQAGLLPALARGSLSPRSAHWPRLTLTPGQAPISRLAAALAALAGADATAVRRSLTTDPQDAHLLVAQAVRADAARRDLPEPGRLVLIVDQFEALFTSAQDENAEEQAAFVTALHAAATTATAPDEAPPALVVLAVRSDYVDRCADFPPLAEALDKGRFVVGPMADEDLRRAITGPADAAGLEIEPGLTDAILAELRSPAGGYPAGALPLLSQAMLMTWEHREDGRLTSRGYAHTGGVGDAVAASAETTYEELTESQRELAERVFRELTVVFGDGRLARRAVERTALRSSLPDGAHADLDHVVETFARRRLLLVAETTVEISHDILLTVWDRLREWLAKDVEDLALHGRLLTTAGEWDHDGRDPSYLYTGARLADVRAAQSRWRADPDRYPALPDVPREFIAASVRAEIRRTRRRQAAVGALAALLAVAVAAAVVAVRAARTADEQRNLAVARLLISESAALRDSDPHLALQLGVAAERTHPGPETRAHLVDTLVTGRYAGRLPASAKGTAGLAFSPDGRTLAASATGTVQLWRMDASGRHRRAGTLPLEQHGRAIVPLFSPDGRLLIIANGDEAVMLWDVSDPARPVRRPAPGLVYDSTDTIVSTALSPDGRTLAVGDDERRVILWNIADPARATRLATISRVWAGREQVDSLAFSPDGRTLAAGGDKAVVLYDVSDAARPTPRGRPLAASSPVAFPARRPLLATQDVSSTDANKFVLWDMSDPARPVRSGTMTGNNSAVAFTPDGRTAATTRYDGTTAIWDVTDPARPVQSGPALAGHTEYALAAAFSPDGRTLATGGHDTSILLWRGPDADRALRRGPTVTGANTFAFRPDRRLVTAGADGSVTLRTASDPARPVARGPGLGGFRTRLAPDGRTLAVSDRRLAVTLWDVTDAARPVRRGPAFVTGHVPLLFSPDGRLLLTVGGEDAALWNVSDPARPVRVRPSLPDDLDAQTLVAAFSPDGRILVTGNIFDGDVDLRSMTDPARRPVRVSAGDAGFVSSVTFSPDGRVMATGRGDGTILLWDMSDPARPLRYGRSLAGVTDTSTGIGVLTSRTAVLAMAFSPDGRTLIATGQSGTIEFWDFTERSNPRRLGSQSTGSSRLAFGLGFSPDGRTVVTTDTAGSMTLWDPAPINDLYDHAVQRACAITGRGLTRTEWAHHIPGIPYRPTCS